MDTVWIKDVGKKDIGIAGGKGANLGEMINKGLPVPPGFIITAKAFRNFLKESLDITLISGSSASMYLIEKDEELKTVYGSIKPVAEISEVSKIFGYPVLEVFADSMEAGIVANITGIIARNNISIRYILAEDPDISVISKLTLVTNEKIPGALVDEFLTVKGVKKIVVST